MKSDLSIQFRLSSLVKYFSGMAKYALVILMAGLIQFPVYAETEISLSEDSEKHLPFDGGIELWTQETEHKKEQERIAVEKAIAEENEDEESEVDKLTEETKKVKAEEKTKIEKVLQQNATTLKLENVVPAIQFSSGQADIPENYVELLRNVLDGMKHRVNVRLHFVGHTDDEKLSGKLQQQYGDNTGLSRERAGTTAEYFQRALNLPPEAISFDGLGEFRPVASNKTATGRAKNRRVEVEVWYDKIDEKLVDKVIQLKEDIKRVKICRIEQLCKIRFKEGHSRRAQLKNLVQPLRYEEGMAEIPAKFIQQLKEALFNLRDKSNVQIKFIGHTDNIPLEGRLARIYGEHVALSKAHARRVALAVQSVMKLPNRAVASDGRGSARPIASMMFQLDGLQIVASKLNFGTMIHLKKFHLNHNFALKLQRLKQ